MKHRLTPEELCRTLRAGLASGILEGQDAVILYDLDLFAQRAAALRTAFPPGTLHAVAIKANPLLAVNRSAKALGLGAEVASLPELHLALTAGFPPSTIVFDSPVKTGDDIATACVAGVILNADSFDELDRLASLQEKGRHPHAVGIRINPQVGEGRIPLTGVAAPLSKFGVPLGEQRAHVIEAFRRFPWLSGLHVHIGSQGYPLELLVRGISMVWDLAEEIRAATGRRDRISFFDIGGGLPAAYRDEEDPPGVHAYASALRAASPGLFEEDLRLMTEFGRMLHAPCGWAVSRIEYVKRFRERTILMTHLGADMFLRVCYNPEAWHHDVVIVDRGGTPRTAGSNRTMIAGPLCFSGDVLERDILLPDAHEGDYLIIRDAGAYTFGMWSRYNSRQFPRVIGYRGAGSSFEVLRERETTDEVIGFWS